MKIALWGYGKYGKKLYRILEEYWKSEYEIVAIYDKNCTEAYVGSILLKSPDSIADDFVNGDFEGVMISVYWESLFYEILNALNEYGIPIVRIGNEADFYPADAFDTVDDAPFKIDQEGYDFHIFKKIYSICSLGPLRESIYLFDKAGKLIADHWNTFPSKDDFFHKYNYPVRFECHGREIVDFGGDWCVLAKLWSSNYSHFSYESMDCVCLLEESGFSGKYVINNAPYCKELMMLYGIAENRIVTTGELDPDKVYCFERLFMPKLLKNDKDNSAPVLKRMSDKIKGKLTKDPEHKKYPHLLYVKRIGSRKLINGDAIASEYGFETIVPDELPLIEQMNYFHNADIVLSAHGANSVNGLYMRSGTVIMETFGRTWVNYCHMAAFHENGVYCLPVVEGPIFPGQRPGKFLDYTIARTNIDAAMRAAFKLAGIDKNA
ncbi:MAG: glycosyltransferase family 61 protein [Eubacterium sp.]|nr:glycosyltransferase family 61 protein [Eubacterium sp.]